VIKTNSRSTGILSVMLFLFFVQATCERPVDLDLAVPNPELVLVCTFAPGQAIQASLSTTRPAIFPNQTTYVNDAAINLFSDEQHLEQLSLQSASFNRPPFFKSSHLADNQGTYRIEVEAEGYPRVKATTTVPQAVPIRRLQANMVGFSPVSSPQEVINYYHIRVSFDDPANLSNFYHLRFMQEIREFVIGESGDTSFTRSRLEQISFGPAINNNTITAYLDDGVLFEDTSFDGKTVSFSFPVQTNLFLRQEIPGHLYVELRTVSEPYYRFYSSLARQQNSPGEPYAEPVIVYSNIENGKGLFAAYNVSKDSIRLYW
jgi:hypothetical protein